MGKQVLDFADKLSQTAELLRRSTVKRRGFKAIGQRARVELNEIKKLIPEIKRTVLENEK